MKKIYYLIFILFLSIETKAQFATPNADSEGMYIDKIFWLAFKPAENGVGLVSWPDMNPADLALESVLKSGEYIWQCTDYVRVRVIFTNTTNNNYIYHDSYTSEALGWDYPAIEPLAITTPEGLITTYAFTATIEVFNGISWVAVNSNNQGIIIADSESLSKDPVYDPLNPREYIDIKTNLGTDVYVIDGRRFYPAWGESFTIFDHYLLAQSNDGVNNHIRMFIDHADASDNFFYAILYAKGLQTAEVTMKGGGRTSSAIGVFIPTLHSTGPEYYGEAVHLQELGDLTGLTPVTGTNPLSHFMTFNNHYPAMTNTSIIRLEDATLSHAEKIFTDGPDDFVMTIDVINQDPLTGTLIAWIDFNGDGIYSGDEYVSYPIPSSPTTQTLNLVFPRSMFQDQVPMNTNYRIRITTDPLVNQNIDPTQQDTRSIGYASNGDVLDRPIRITSTTLPLEFIHFSVEHIKDGNILRWETAHEINTAHFEIERSLNGLNGWTKIGKVSSINQSLPLNKYEFKDKNISNGSVFYRIKQVDIDGVFTYSNIVHTKTNIIEKSITLYPQPFQNQLIVRMNIETRGAYQFEIFSMNGNKVLAKNQYLDLGLRDVMLNISSNVSNGTYILKISRNNQSVYSGLILKQ